jgi:hypothetical protein
VSLRGLAMRGVPGGSRWAFRTCGRMNDFVSGERRPVVVAACQLPRQHVGAEQGQGGAHPR